MFVPPAEKANAVSASKVATGLLEVEKLIGPKTNQSFAGASLPNPLIWAHELVGPLVVVPPPKALVTILQFAVPAELTVNHWPKPLVKLSGP